MPRFKRWSRSRWEKAPRIVVREVDDERQARGDTATREVGKIVSTLFPSSEDFGPGHQGTSITFQSRKPYLRYDMEGDPEKVVGDHFMGKTVSLEVRYTGNRAIQDVIFRGRIDSKAPVLAKGSNSVDITFRDGWFWLTESPVDMPTQNQTVGGILRAIDNGYWSERRWNSGAETYLPSYNYFSPVLWPTNGDGERIVFLDPEMLTDWTPTGDTDLRGEVTAKVVADLIRKSGEYIPALRYKGRDVYVTRLKRGWMKMDLVVGTIGKYGAAHRLVPSVLSIQGTTTYSGIANRIIGRGNYTWKSALVELEPAWDATLEDDVKEDPKLAANAPYSYVGTLYRIPTDIYPFDLAGSNEDGSDADPRPKGFSMQLHTRVGLEVEGEPDLENDPWQPLKVGYKMPETLEDEDLKDLPMDRRTKYHFRAGNFRYIRFDGPMTHEYYTPEQQAQVDAGTEDVEKTVVYMQVRAQAIEIGGRVQADSGHQGNYPYQVTRFVEARQAKVIEDDAERVEPNDTGGLTVITQKKTRSDYRALRSYVDKLAERVARPDEGYNVVMPYLHMGQLLGVEINRILSSEGDLMESGLEWAIAGGSRDYFGLKTSLLLSDSFYQLQAGASIMFAGGK